jgi:hypothetical protein
VSLLATQPFFGLSPAQVREFYQMLLDVGATLSTLYSSPRNEEDDDDSYDVTTTTLPTKVRFVQRSSHQGLPAMLGLDALRCELTKDELTMLELQVLGLISDLQVEETSWFYAFESFVGTYHLMQKDHYDRHGPALCGVLPTQLLPESSYRIKRGWFLQPLQPGKQPDYWRLCRSCQRLYQDPQSCEASGAKDTIQQKQNHYRLIRWIGTQWRSFLRA